MRTAVTYAEGFGDERSWKTGILRPAVLKCIRYVLGVVLSSFHLTHWNCLRAEKLSFPLPPIAEVSRSLGKGGMGTGSKVQRKTCNSARLLVSKEREENNQ